MTSQPNPDSNNHLDPIVEESISWHDGEPISFNNLLKRSDEAISPIPKRASEIRPNRDALVSFICSLSVVVILWIIPFGDVALSVVGIIFGHKYIKETVNIPHAKRGLAIAGLICGYIALPLSIFMSLHFLLDYVLK